MWIFEKKETLLEGKNPEAISRAENILRDAGIRTNVWETQELPVGGCGAKMRPQDYAGKTKAPSTEERKIYHLEVKREDAEKARALLAANH